MRVFSYVVEHDSGYAPNPYSGSCTLCRCKYRKSRRGHRNVVELAQRGDWIVGTGGARLDRSAGHGKLIYAMLVTEPPITREQYYASRRFKSKRPVSNGNHKQRVGDNEPPENLFERQHQFVLISRHFSYFGRKAIGFSRAKFPDLEKKGPGFRSDFDEAYIKRFVKWIATKKRGIQGEPCMKDKSVRKHKRVCKSPC